ncbi:MAG: UDP-3-O-(3-hydroxymyristoyl)glucosamine N-acyltransferase [Candidatus Eisenbacteria bacterium]|uniref:UDP-3-O-acylglucosamine N-acyltransferase n=1 Tax=Eiseniibacteriota bacterium TaxID=2212470 RepID=A0A7Y2EBW2_UNCEI|nr:UDP-3-O-(3-hydroxymyristoyl)glucosamine N-acyltransferase [Candidatus Eisenbacteria bacterium]
MAKPKTLGYLAERLRATLDGDPDYQITGVAGLEEARPGDVSFLASPKYEFLIDSCEASALVVPKGYSGSFTGAKLHVDDPYTAFCHVIVEFRGEANRRSPGRHPTSVIDPDAQVGENLSAGPYVVVEAGAVLGDDVVLWPGVFVGRRAKVGSGSLLYPGVQILNDCEIGDRNIVHGGAVIGSDGFGYVSSAEGHEKIPHVGNVTIGDDVEIGANVTIDRGTLGSTRIGNGVKIDNLVHVAHNVVVGDHSLLVAQVGISGSSTLGDWVTVGGQAGMAGHLQVGNHSRIAARAGLTKSIPADTTVSGFPAIPHEESKRVMASWRRLPDLLTKIRDLEKRLRDLEHDLEDAKVGKK